MTSPRVIGFHYTLTNGQGEVMDSSLDDSPLYFMEGAQQIIPGLEKTLVTLKVGDKKKVLVPAVDAYGPREDDRVVSVPRDRFPAGQIEAGDIFRTDDEHSQPLRVVKVTDTHVTLDGNHPLAGMDLTFDVEITEIREATKDEMAHGHAHGPHSHH